MTTPPTPETLGEALPREMARVRDEVIEFEACGHRYRLRVFRRVNVGLENEGWAHEQEATAELLLASGFAPASSLAAAKSKLTEQIQANEALMAGNWKAECEALRVTELAHWAENRRLEQQLAAERVKREHLEQKVALFRDRSNALLNQLSNGEDGDRQFRALQKLADGEWPEVKPEPEPAVATPAPPPEGPASPVVEGETYVFPDPSEPNCPECYFPQSAHHPSCPRLRSQPTTTVERQAQAEGCPYPDCDCSGCVFCRVNHSPEAHENCHCRCGRRAEGAKAAEGTYPNFREDVLLSMGVDWTWYGPEVLLDEVDEDPDSDEGYPPFGVDPGDSAALEKLRMSVDDNLIWRDEKQQEAGDYEGAVEYSGELATECLELRAERAALVELLSRVDAFLFSKPANWKRDYRNTLDPLLTKIGDALCSLRAQPSPTSEAKDSSPSGASTREDDGAERSAPRRSHDPDAVGDWINDGTQQQPLPQGQSPLDATAKLDGETGPKSSPPPTPGGHGPTEVLRAEVVAAARAVCARDNNAHGDLMGRFADELARQGEKP